MTWKSSETSLEGIPLNSGQLPVPDSSIVHVMGSPALTWVGTTLEAMRKSPTAPVKPCGAGGSGRTLIATGPSGTANCWYCLCWKKPKPVTPTLRLTSWLVGLRRMRPASGARALVW